MRTMDEIIEKLNQLSGDDPEAEHGVADELLCDALELAGMVKVVEAYNNAQDRVGFWYA